MPTEAEWLRLYDTVRLMRATVGHDHREPWPCPVVLVDEALAPILRAIPDRDYPIELAAIFLARLAAPSLSSSPTAPVNAERLRQQIETALAKDEANFDLDFHDMLRHTFTALETGR